LAPFSAACLGPEVCFSGVWLKSVPFSAACKGPVHSTTLMSGLKP
jgi:hypothetical protein